MKYASLMYSTSNIGDNFQTIGAGQHFPLVKFVLIINGWYTLTTENWPPSESIIIIFIGQKRNYGIMCQAA